MNVQVILREGEPEYAVLPWAEYQALRAAAGLAAEAKAPQLAVQAAEPELMPLTELARLREARGLSAADLARAAGISPAYLAMIETGERQPDAAIKRSLAMAVGVAGWGEPA